MRFAIVLHWLPPYRRLPLLGPEVPLLPFLGLPLGLLLILPFCPQLRVLTLAVPSGEPSRAEAPVRSAPQLADLVTPTVDLEEFRGAYAYLCSILDRFGDQSTARLRGALDCFSGWVRAADRRSVKASQLGSRGGTAAELRRALQELAEAEME